MYKRHVFILLTGLVLISGCNQQGQLNKSMRDAVENMAKHVSVQKAFSEGRIKVIENDRDTKSIILQNTVKEQAMIVNDPNLHKELMKIQNESRKKAIQNAELQNLILQQNVHEHFLALNNPATSQATKEFSLKTTEAILKDKKLKTKFLAQNIQAFGDISAAPSLRKEMADAMLPLLKDPKIAKELETMMKQMLAAEMKKLQVQMQQQQQQMQKMQKIQMKSQQLQQPANSVTKQGPKTANPPQPAIETKNKSNANNRVRSGD